jgi:hypothetical protein
MEELQGEYRKAREVYFSLRLTFRGLGDGEAVAWSYFKEREMERLCNVPGQARRFYGPTELGDTSDAEPTLTGAQLLHFQIRHSLKWFWYWMMELASGYGQRPWRTAVTLFVLFLCFLLLYSVTGAVERVDPVTGTRTAPDVGDVVLYTMTGFTTLNPVGVEPRTVLAQIALNVQALVGLLLVGLFGFVMGKYIAKS